MRAKKEWDEGREILDDCLKVPCCGRCKSAFLREGRLKGVGAYTGQSGKVIGVDRVSITSGVTGVWSVIEREEQNP